MSDQTRLDADMAGFLADGAAEAKKYPPIEMELPYEPHRLTVEMLGKGPATGGPVMAETTDRWVAARGRRILCRIYRPRTDQLLPVMVHFHGGGWIQSSIDTHDRLAREYAAAGDVAVVSVDFALSPEARFPQALEECAAVVRYLSDNGSAWNVDGSRILLGGDSAGGNLALHHRAAVARQRWAGSARDPGKLSGMRCAARHAQLPIVRCRRVRSDTGANVSRLALVCVRMRLTGCIHWRLPCAPI